MWGYLCGPRLVVQLNMAALLTEDAKALRALLGEKDHTVVKGGSGTRCYFLL